MPVKQYFDTKLALGSDATFVLVTDAGQAAADRLLAGLWRRTFTFERQFSRFLPMSELSVFNRSAGLKQRISPEFRALLLAAKDMGRQTGGLFNPFMLPALQRAGYTKSFVEKYAKDAHDDFSGRQVVKVAALEVGDDWARIPYGTAIDLGGCGKGYLADQLAAGLPRDIVQGYWLSLGGDIAAGGRDDQERPWTVYIQSALDAGRDCPWAIQGPVDDFAVATSGTGVRQGRHRGRRWHHIIDPRTQRPARTDIRLATVHTASALAADVLASCAIIAGSEQAPVWLAAHGARAGLLQVAGGSRTGIITFGNSLQAIGIKEEAGEHA